MGDPESETTTSTQPNEPKVYTALSTRLLKAHSEAVGGSDNELGLRGFDDPLVLVRPGFWSSGPKELDPCRGN